MRRDYTSCISVVKTKALISCTVTAQLICAFVFAYAKIFFSRDLAQVIVICKLTLTEHKYNVVGLILSFSTLCLKCNHSFPLQTLFQCFLHTN